MYREPYVHCISWKTVHWELFKLAVDLPLVFYSIESPVAKLSFGIWRTNCLNLRVSISFENPPRELPLWQKKKIASYIDLRTTALSAHAPNTVQRHFAVEMGYSRPRIASTVLKELPKLKCLNDTLSTAIPLMAVEDLQSSLTLQALNLSCKSWSTEAKPKPLRWHKTKNQGLSVTEVRRTITFGGMHWSVLSSSSLWFLRSINTDQLRLCEGARLTGLKENGFWAFPAKCFDYSTFWAPVFNASKSTPTFTQQTLNQQRSTARFRSSGK